MDRNRHRVKCSGELSEQGMPVDVEGALREQALVRLFFGEKRDGFFVEVGANEPTNLSSQTWHLEQLGWHGILIEPIKSLCAASEAQRPRSRVYNAACTAPEKVGVGELKIPVFPDREASEFAALDLAIDHAAPARYRVEEVPLVSLDSILEEMNPSPIDLLSIDVEGTELDVLKGFSIWRYKPRLILIEDRMVYLNKHLYLKRNGYKLVLRTGFDNWYIPRDEVCELASVKERMRLFKKLYIGLLFRKIKESVKMRNLRPFATL